MAETTDPKGKQDPPADQQGQPAPSDQPAPDAQGQPDQQDPAAQEPGKHEGEPRESDLCPACFPLGLPEGYLSAGCEHSL